MLASIGTMCVEGSGVRGLYDNKCTFFWAVFDLSLAK